MNLYRYVGNNPYTNTDPTGLRGNTAFAPLSIGSSTSAYSPLRDMMSSGPSGLLNPQGAAASGYSGLGGSGSLIANSVLDWKSSFNLTTYQPTPFDVFADTVSSQSDKAVAKLSGIVTGIPGGLRATKDFVSDAGELALGYAAQSLGLTSADDNDAIYDVEGRMDQRFNGVTGYGQQVYQDFKTGNAQAMGDDLLDLSQLSLSAAIGIKTTKLLPSRPTSFAPVAVPGAEAVATNVKVLSRLREIRLQGKLESRFGESNVLRERMLLDSYGNKVFDPVTGEGRRIDFIIRDSQGNARFSVEATSRNQVRLGGKANQLAKEANIRNAGGVYVRDPTTGQLIDISHTPTRVIGVEP